jgi:hypothetical protein
MLDHTRRHPLPWPAIMGGSALLTWTTSGSPGPTPAGYCFLCDCERVLVAAGGASDGDARFAGDVSTAGS